MELAPRAITAFPLGGIGILPQCPTKTNSNNDTLNRVIALWPNTRLGDGRLEIGDDLVLVRSDPALSADRSVRAVPLRVGLLNRRGWVAYLRGETLFVKRFTPQSGLPHADAATNVAAALSDHFIELETIAPLVKLAPGQSATHREIWEVYHVVASADLAETICEVAATIDLG
jgi:hypothetical protein